MIVSTNEIEYNKDRYRSTAAQAVGSKRIFHRSLKKVNVLILILNRTKSSLFWRTMCDRVWFSANGVQEAAGSTPVTRTKEDRNAVLFSFSPKVKYIEPCGLA